MLPNETEIRPRQGGVAITLIDDVGVEAQENRGVIAVDQVETIPAESDRVLKLLDVVARVSYLPDSVERTDIPSVALVVKLQFVRQICTGP